MFFETNSFFGSLVILKMHQLRKLINIRMSKHILSISCEGSTNCQLDAAKFVALSRINICVLGWKTKKIRTITLCFASVNNRTGAEVEFAGGRGL